MGRLAVLQPDGLCHLLCHPDLLARTVDELEVALREHDGQGNTRKAAPRAKVEDLRTWTEVHHLCDGQRVEHMVLVEVVDVFARDHVDLRIPVTIEGVEGVELPLLLLTQLGEIFLDDGCCHIIKLWKEFFSIFSNAV